MVWVPALVLSAAAATLAPPNGEALLPWEEAARLAGLTLGGAGAPDGVTLESLGDGRLKVRAIDTKGRERVLVVAWPRTAAERQDIVSLGASLLRSLDAPVRAPMLAALEKRTAVPPAVPVEPQAPVSRGARSGGPPPKAAPERPADSAPTEQRLPVEAPSAVAGEEGATEGPSPAPPPAELAAAEPSPEPVADTTAEVGVGPPATAEPDVVAMESPASGRPRLGIWASAGPGLGWRASTGSGTWGIAAAGVFSDDLRIGLRGEWAAPREVLSVGEEASVGGWGLSLGGWWWPRRTVAPVVGVLAGASRLEFLDGAEPVAGFWRSRVAVDAGLSWQMAPAVGLVAMVHPSLELAQTTVQVGDLEPVMFSPWQLGASLGLHAQFQ